MRKFNYEVGVIAWIFILNLSFVQIAIKSLEKVNLGGEKQKDMSDDGRF